MPAAPLSSAPAGLAGPVRGVGGPAAIQMQPKAQQTSADASKCLLRGFLTLLISMMFT